MSFLFASFFSGSECISLLARPLACSAPSMPHDRLLGWENQAQNGSVSMLPPGVYAGESDAVEREGGRASDAQGQVEQTSRHDPPLKQGTKQTS